VEGPVRIDDDRHGAGVGLRAGLASGKRDCICCRHTRHRGKAGMQEENAANGRAARPVAAFSSGGRKSPSKYVHRRQKFHRPSAFHREKALKFGERYVLEGIGRNRQGSGDEREERGMETRRSRRISQNGYDEHNESAPRSKPIQIRTGKGSSKRKKATGLQGIVVVKETPLRRLGQATKCKKRKYRGSGANREHLTIRSGS